MQTSYLQDPPLLLQDLDRSAWEKGSFCLLCSIIIFLNASFGQILDSRALPPAECWIVADPDLEADRTGPHDLLPKPLFAPLVRPPLLADSAFRRIRASLPTV